MRSPIFTEESLSRVPLVEIAHLLNDIYYHHVDVETTEQFLKQEHCLDPKLSALVKFLAR